MSTTTVHCVREEAASTIKLCVLYVSCVLCVCVVHFAHTLTYFLSFFLFPFLSFSLTYLLSFSLSYLLSIFLTF